MLIYLPHFISEYRQISLTKQVEKLTKDSHFDKFEKLFIDDIIGNGWISNYVLCLLCLDDFKINKLSVMRKHIKKPMCAIQFIWSKKIQCE